MKLRIVACLVVMIWPVLMSARWVVASAHHGGDSLTVPATEVLFSGESYSLQGEDLVPLLETLCSCRVPSSDGEHRFERRAASPTTQYVIFRGPLSVLGRGTLHYEGFISFVLGPESSLSNLIVANVDALLYPTWTSALDEARQRNVAFTSQAAVELWKLTSGADVVLRTRPDDLRLGPATAAARRLIRDVSDDTRSRRVITSSQIEVAGRKLCPIYPFCRRRP